ncbi:UNVERIFIED_ORG: putative cobalt transporter CbtA [Methylorubrum zatmanii]
MERIERDRSFLCTVQRPRHHVAAFSKQHPHDSTEAPEPGGAFAVGDVEGEWPPSIHAGHVVSSLLGRLALWFILGVLLPHWLDGGSQNSV